MNRELRLSKKHDYDIMPKKPNIAIQAVQMINNDGNIVTETKKVLVNESEMISKIPAYSTKIEYMQLYGTLDKNNVVKYAHCNPHMSEIDVIKLRDKILENGFVVEKKVEEQKTEE